jgi:hydroxyethylthiazole kinase-like uncharacterized protein yjeF
MKIVTCAQMKEAEAYAIGTGITSMRLMENAGSASARFIKNSSSLTGSRCTIICGRGNNGGDGFVVARRLQDSGALLTVVLACGVPRSSEAVEMFERLSVLNIPVIDNVRDSKKCLQAISQSTVIIDAIFGTGFKGDIEDSLAVLIGATNKSGAMIFSLDMPSGANADSGTVAKACIKANYTIAFGACKTGQFIFPAAEFCGKMTVVNIGIPQEAFKSSILAELLSLDMIKEVIPARAKNSHKGNYGRLLCFCGSLGMAGAAYMSATAAARCGAGIVNVYAPRSIFSALAAKFSEIMIAPLDETEDGTLCLSNLERCITLASKADTVLIGCGLSQNSQTFELVRELIKKLTCTVVLDADGINAFAGHINILRETKANLILTPHPGEMARLIGRSVSQIEEDRLNIAGFYAKELAVTLVLKGADTLIASPNGQIYVNPTGNPGMARGGSGDILAGMIAGFAAQGFGPLHAACCGAYLHGLAGDRCAAKLSQYGMLPTDMLSEIPQIFREISR